MSAAAPDPELTPVKRALIEIRDLRARVAALQSQSREPIAIVGTGLRFPAGIDDLDALWQLLEAGTEAITEIPRERWDLDALYDDDADAPGKMFTRHGAFLDRVDCFDADFFGISPREAESMDPQQRIVLETAWHAFEDAGIAPTSLHGSRTGVFIGVCNNDYGRMLFAHRERIDPYFSPGNAGSVVAGRLSYFLGAHGPSIAVDTACSSSLVALHLAVQSLRAGECDLALAGGINLILSPEMNINFSKGRMMARDGRCKTFDASADGYVRGEGCGLVVLRRLRDCAPGDRVLAVVRGSAINQDGRSSGLTAPNGPAQEAVIRAALAAADVVPAHIAYVETHGTGTPLGDPIEVQALAAVLGEGRPASQPVAIGSIKTNLGHLEAAAGIAGVLKAVLALQHRQIPPHLHLKTPNPHIDWTASAVVVPTEATPLPALAGRHLVGVSSFGFSGTNAHVILEAAPEPDAPREPAPATTLDERPQHVLALSARDAQGLAALAAACAERVQESGAALADLCHSANVGRAHFAHRLAVRADSTETLHATLQAAARGHAAPTLVRGIALQPPPRIAFLFTGGGAQTAGMALGLYRHAPVFRAALDDAAAILDPLLGRPLLDIITSHDGSIDETRYGQPALVAVEIALAALWRSWGIAPAAVLGHSLGEYAAAHVAGVLSLADALHIVVQRTRLVDALAPAGGMATIGAAAAEVEAALASLRSGATIAAINGPEQVVVSGAPADVDAIAQHFEQRGVRASRLRVAYASHSPMMEPVLAPFEQSLSDVRFSPPRVTFVSNLTGQPAGLELIGRARYWRDHLREPVRFAQSVQALDGLGITHYVEIGPHPVLVGMGAACLAPDRAAWLPSLRREHDDWDVILETLQHLYVAGADVDWRGFDAGRVRRRIALPTYPFQRRRHWAEWASAPLATVDASRTWEAVQAALGQQAGRAPIGVDLAHCEAQWGSLERLTIAETAELLRGAGLFNEPGQRLSDEDVRARLGAADGMRQLLGRWLQRLADHALLRRDGDAFVSERPLAAHDLAACWRDAESQLAGNRPLLDYVRHCASLLPAVLRGAESPLETLFPGGTFELADGLYRRSATMRYINGLAAAAVQAFVAARGGAPLRVLEIGAGTGGTTAALLPVLPTGRTRYRFTDVSPFFFDRARQEFAGFAGMEFTELDIDRDLAGQGVMPGSFDLVLAANAVHASRDLRAALRRLRELVAPGGLLLLVESTVHMAWFDITTGLIEGWQHFADDLRQDNPLLSAPTWVQALREAGFDDAGAWPQDGPAQQIGQHVVVARVAGQSLGGAEPEGPHAAPVEATTATPAEEAGQRRQRIAEALPADRHDLLCDFVRERVMDVLKLDALHPPARNDRLMDIGFDSLMAVQLRNRLGSGLGLDKPLPATVMFDHPTIDALASFLLQRLALPATNAPADGAPGASAVAAAAPAPLGAEAVAAMSDAEIEALLLSRLEPR